MYRDPESEVENRIEKKKNCYIDIARKHRMLDPSCSGEKEKQIYNTL